MPTQRTTPDAATQAYIERMRQLAGQASDTALAGPGGGGSWFTGPLSTQDIQSAFNPYMQNVIGGVRGEFDHLRGLAGVEANQQATQQGAFGGSRHGVMQGARLGALDRAQTSQIGGLLHRGYQDARGFAEHQRGLREQQLQEPLFRNREALNFLNMNIGPSGNTTSMDMERNWLGQMAGGALAGYGAFGSPWGAVGGGIVGGLGGFGYQPGMGGGGFSPTGFF